jgi:hypothetical protein
MSGTINTSATGGYIVGQPPQPPTGEQITRALQKMVMALAGLPGMLVRPRWQPMPPSQPQADVTWASVGITKVEADDYPAIIHDGSGTFPGALAPGVDRMQRHATLTVLVTFYGPEAETCAASLRDALYMPQNWEPTEPIGLKLRDVRDLARTAEIINQQWVDRFDMELELRQQIDRVYPVYNLDGADVVLHRENPDGTVDDTTITVRPTTVINPY